MTEIALYYYPTNIVLIDDNELFLANLAQTLSMKSPHLQYRTYSNPLEALENVNGKHQQQLRHHKVYIDSEQEHASQFVFDVLNKGRHVKTAKGRLDEVSVLVVDLDMPGIDGIELCQKVDSPNIKKILLTGVAATDRVINAFNNDDIHFYISKGQEDMDVQLEEAIHRLQNEYFLDISSKIKTDALSGSTNFFSDPAFADYFATLSKQLGVCEFYFAPKPSRYNLKLNNNNEVMLLLYTEKEIDEHIAVLKEEDAPAYLIESLQKGHVPYFSTADGFYEAQHPEVDNWLTYPATIIEGQQRYRCAVLNKINEDDIPSLTLHSTINHTLH